MVLQLPQAGQKRIVVSHSECDSITLCEQRHYYAFGEKLEPIEKSDSLQRGITGHHFMHIFLKELQYFGDWDTAIVKLNDELAQAVVQVKTTKQFENLTYLATTINSFLEFYKDRICAWDIIEVEQTHILDCGDYDFAFTVDALIREAGRVTVLDWKFVYDFYTDNQVQIAPQIPRYIGALRAMGQTVSGGMYGFLRYRNIKPQGEGNRFKLLSFSPTVDRIQRSHKDLMISVENIAKKKQMELSEWHETARRASNMIPCKTCSFIDLCVEELNGGDGNLTRRMYYKPSTYGYDNSSGD